MCAVFMMGKWYGCIVMCIVWHMVFGVRMLSRMLCDVCVIDGVCVGDICVMCCVYGIHIMLCVMCDTCCVCDMMCVV